MTFMAFLLTFLAGAAFGVFLGVYGTMTLLDAIKEEGK